MRLVGIPLTFVVPQCFCAPVSGVMNSVPIGRAISTRGLTTTPLSNRESESSTAGFRAPDRNLEGFDRHPDLSAGTESPGAPGPTLP